MDNTSEHIIFTRDYLDLGRESKSEKFISELFSFGSGWSCLRRQWLMLMVAVGLANGGNDNYQHSSIWSRA